MNPDPASDRGTATDESTATPAPERVRQPPRRGWKRATRICLGSAIVIVSINIWTGAPLAALWIAAHVQHGSLPTLGYVATTAVALALIAFALLRLLSVLDAAYRNSGSSSRERVVRTHAPWLRSMRGERERYPDDRAPAPLADRVMVLTVAVCVIAFEVWFFFFAHYTLPGGGAR